jgi:hypothetical protein
MRAERRAARTPDRAREQKAKPMLDETFTVLLSRTTIQKMHSDLRDILSLLENLLKRVGVPAHCPDCGIPILRIRYANGKLAQYNHNGTNHAASCEKSVRESVTG